MYKFSFVLLFTSLLLTACGEDKKSYAELGEDNVFKGQVEAIDKARGVKDTIHSSFDQQRQQIDKQ